MLHFLASALFLYIVLILLLPQQVAAATLLLGTTLVTLFGKLDWTTIPWQP